MAMLAPIVMGVLGRMKQSKRLDANRLPEVLQQSRQQGEKEVPGLGGAPRHARRHGAGRAGSATTRSVSRLDPAQTYAGLYRNVLLHLKRDDGAAVLPQRRGDPPVNLPSGAGDDTHAAASVNGAAEEVYYPVDVKLELLRAGRNVIAVELHQDEIPRRARHAAERAASSTTCRRRRTCSLPPTAHRSRPASRSRSASTPSTATARWPASSSGSRKATSSAPSRSSSPPTPRPPSPPRSRPTSPPGHYMVWAVAVDDRGEESPSMMVHIGVVGEGGHGH